MSPGQPEIAAPMKTITGVIGYLSTAQMAD